LCGWVLRRRGLQEAVAFLNGQRIGIVYRNKALMIGQAK
jgi:hypothetical protein